MGKSYYIIELSLGYTKDTAINMYLWERTDMFSFRWHDSICNSISVSPKEVRLYMYVLYIYLHVYKYPDR